MQCADEDAALVKKWCARNGITGIPMYPPASLEYSDDTATVAPNNVGSQQQTDHTSHSTERRDEVLNPTKTEVIAAQI